MTVPTLAETCIVACSEAWRDDGEILASPMGIIPAIEAKLARATHAPDLLLSNGEAHLIHGNPAIGEPGMVEGWVPFQFIFDLVAHGRRHVMMGASQIDRQGNQNISCIGPWDKPKVQLIGTRGAPGNTINHPTSYWVPNHSPKIFVEQVDVVCGVGYTRAAAAGPGAARFHDLRRIVTNLAVLDCDTPDHRMRLVSTHPGVSVEQVVESTGFELVVEDPPETRQPTAEEIRLIREVLDPGGVRNTERLA